MCVCIYKYIRITIQRVVSTLAIPFLKIRIPSKIKISPNILMQWSDLAYYGVTQDRKVGEKKTRNYQNYLPRKYLWIYIFTLMTNLVFGRFPIPHDLLFSFLFSFLYNAVRAFRLKGIVGKSHLNV